MAYPTQSGTPAAKANYTLDGATLGNSNIVKDVTAKAGTNGIGISGNVTAVTGSTIDLTNAGMSVYAGAKADLSAANVSGEKTITVGKDASCTIPSTGTNVKTENIDTTKPTSVDDYPGLVEAMKLGYSKITLDNEIQINENIDLGATAITADKSKNFEIAKDVSVTFNGGSYKGPIEVSGVSADIALYGTFTLKGGSLIINDLTYNGDEDNKITVTSGKVVISGALNAELTIIAGQNASGVEIDLTDLNITSAGKLTFQGFTTSNSTIEANGTVSVYGQIMADEKITIEAQADTTFRAYGGSVLQDTVTVVSADPTDETIIVNLDGAMHTLTINDDINSSNIYGQTQTVVIGSTLDIVSGTTVEIRGQFIVNKGVTLTIQAGAKLIINGTTSVMDVNGNIIVDAGGILEVRDSKAVDIAGSVQIYGTMSVGANGAVTVQEGGNVTVAVGGALNVSTGTTVKAGATVDILGNFDIDGITNEGTINLTGAVMTGDADSKITLKNGGAVNVNSFTSNTANVGLSIVDEVDNTVTLVPNTAKTGFSGIIVTAEKTGTTEEPVYTLYVSGTVAGVNNTDGDGPDAYPVKISGTGLAVSGDLTLGEKVQLAVDSNAKVKVSGTITATAKGCAFTNAGTIDVTGTITTSENKANIGGTVNAVYYTITGTGAGATSTTTYTTFENAVQSSATKIYVGFGTGSEVTVLEDATVPGTMTVDVVGKLIIGDKDTRDITVTISDGCNVSGNVTEVFATMTFENSRNDNASVTSDVVINAEPVRTYTNLYTALASGAETVTLAGPVVLTSSITVPEGTTLVVPAGTGVTFNAGVTMTVNGVVQTAVNLTGPAGGFDEKSASNTDDKKTAKIVVNGKFMTSVTGMKSETLYGQYKIPGAYYNISDATGAFIVVAPVATAAAEDAADIVGNVIAVYGEVSMGDVAFNGTEENPLEIDVYGKATGNVTLSYAGLGVAAANAANTPQFTGTVSSEIGSIELVNVNTVYVAGIIVEEDGADVEYMYLFGAPAQADAKVDASITVASGNVTVPTEYPLSIAEVQKEVDNKTVPANAVALDVANGATLTVNGKLTAYDITVNGTLVSIDGGDVRLTEAFVFGTLTVAETDTEAKVDAGSAEIGTLYVGLDKKYDNMTAAVNGDVAVTSKMIVSSQSAVDAEFLGDFAESTAFNVEGSVWFTAYANSGIGVTVDDVKIENALFVGWSDEQDGEVIYSDAANKVVKTDFAIGENETLYAVIDYEIYTVTITADAGIGTVAVDGKVLQKNGNQFTISGLKAGTHTIDYILNSGFGGTPVISVNGEAITGNAFTLSGTSASDMNISISIYGTQPSTSTGGSTSTTGGDDGMGLTDYLLIILVVLIVIMAIMVALRMLRS